MNSKSSIYWAFAILLFVLLSVSYINYRQFNNAEQARLKRIEENRQMLLQNREQILQNRTMIQQNQDLLKHIESNRK